MADAELTHQRCAGRAAKVHRLKHYLARRTHYSHSLLKNTTTYVCVSVRNDSMLHKHPPKIPSARRENVPGCTPCQRPDIHEVSSAPVEPGPRYRAAIHRQ